MTIKTYSAKSNSMTLAELQAELERRGIVMTTLDLRRSTFYFIARGVKFAGKKGGTDVYKGMGPTIEAAIRAALELDE